jgi:hypothetical protein
MTKRGDFLNNHIALEDIQNLSPDKFDHQLNCAVFLFMTPKTTLLTPKTVDGFVSRLKSHNTSIVYKTTDEHVSRDSLLKQHLGLGVEWLKQLDQTRAKSVDR